MSKVDQEEDLMSIPMTRWIVFFMLCLMSSFIVADAQASSFSGSPINDFIHRSHHLVLGEVISVEERRGEYHQRYEEELRFFVVTASVRERAKGSYIPGSKIVFASTRPPPGYSTDFGTAFEVGKIYALAIRCGSGMISDSEGEEFCSSVFFRTPELTTTLPEGLDHGRSGEERWLRVSDWRNAGLRFPGNFPVHYTDGEDIPICRVRRAFVAWMRWEDLAGLVR